MEQDNSPNSLTGLFSGIDSIKQFTGNQAKELEIKYIEVQTAQKNSEYQYNYATKQLEAQERNLENERQYKLKQYKLACLIVIAVIFIVCVFFGFCVYREKDQLVVELLRVVCYGGSFGFGGFYWGKSKGRDKIISENQGK
jgi:ABC-type multidrug transport system permease subunit